MHWIYQKPGANENPRKAQKADITRKLAFWATKVATKANFLGVEQLGLTTSLVIHIQYFFSVVYEHKSRLEKSLQQEKSDHRKSKNGKILILGHLILRY